MLLCFSSLSDKGSAAFHLPVLNREGAKGVFGWFVPILEEGSESEQTKPCGRKMEASGWLTSLSAVGSDLSNPSN
jgi:hypothetical protein